jgi:hypothetical protein
LSAGASGLSAVVFVSFVSLGLPENKSKEFIFMNYT